MKALAGVVPSEAPLLGTCVATVLLPPQAVISPCTCIHGVCTFPFLYKDTSHFRLASYLNSLIYLFELQLPSLKIFFPSAVAFWDMGRMRHQHLNFGGRKFAHNTWLVFPSSCLWNTSHTIFFKYQLFSFLIEHICLLSVSFDCEIPACFFLLLCRTQHSFILQRARLVIYFGTC